MPNSSDLALARAVLDGDPAAFGKIYELYFPPVLAFARRRRADEGAARTLAATIWTTAFEHLHGYSGRTSLAAWMVAVARLVARRAGAASAAA
jgi:DNA-directed RNA polymerase specialized sigma24 family protein